MAKVIIENRQFTNQNTGEITEYQYIAIQGGTGSKIYEVQLKNLVQSEKVALSMINDLENNDIKIESRRATKDEQDNFFKENNDGDNFNLD